MGVLLELRAVVRYLDLTGAVTLYGHGLRFGGPR